MTLTRSLRRRPETRPCQWLNHSSSRGSSSDSDLTQPGSLRACHSLSLVVMLAQVLSGPARACHGPARPAVIWQLYHLPD